jgi:hypothetical protein
MQLLMTPENRATATPFRKSHSVIVAWVYSAVGAKTTGSATCWPRRSVDRSSTDTSRSTLCRKATFSRSETLRRRVASASGAAVDVLEEEVRKPASGDIAIVDYGGGLHSVCSLWAASSRHRSA